MITTLFNGMEQSIIEKVLHQLREIVADDITAIVNNTLEKNKLYNTVNSGEGWITIDDLCKKYKVSRFTVTEKCRIFKEGQFKIERLPLGKNNLINEKQFLIACQQKEGKKKPKFLKK